MHYPDIVFYDEYGAPYLQKLGIDLLKTLGRHGGGEVFQSRGMGETSVYEAKLHAQANANHL